LRADLHSIFEAKKFAIVPKRSADDSEKPVLVVHAFVGHPHSEIAQLYHNVAPQPLSEIAIEFLFARFGWTIFHLLTVFLNGRVPRILSVCFNEGYFCQTFTAVQCMEMGKTSPSRSVTPRKRKPATGTSPEELEDGLEDKIEDESEDGIEDGLEDGDLDFEARRGRKRRRTSSLWSTTSTSVMSSGNCSYIVTWHLPCSRRSRALRESPLSRTNRRSIDKMVLG